jgi:aspartyl-tRNA(Asn)/glutamyl-tRNA(Gln) amidotransferase subunit B
LILIVPEYLSWNLLLEPVIHDAETAMNFGKELQLLLRTLGVAHANMEKGEMRVELNVSVSDQEGTFGTKVEGKNLK